MERYRSRTFLVSKTFQRSSGHIITKVKCSSIPETFPKNVSVSYSSSLWLVNKMFRKRLMGNVSMKRCLGRTFLISKTFLSSSGYLYGNVSSIKVYVSETYMIPKNALWAESLGCGIDCLRTFSLLFQIPKRSSPWSEFQFILAVLGPKSDTVLKYNGRWKKCLTIQNNINMTFHFWHWSSKNFENNEWKSKINKL